MIFLAINLEEKLYLYNNFFKLNLSKINLLIIDYKVLLKFEIIYFNNLNLDLKFKWSVF
jgi:hypothetical protein